MTDLPLDRRLQPTLLLPPIASLPAPARVGEPARAVEPDALAAYLPTTRAWHRHPITVPTSVVCALWVILAGAVGIGSWLVAERVDGTRGSGIVYRVAVLGHPGLVLVLAGICAVILLGLAPFTRGLTRAGGPELAAMTLAGIAGAASLLGVVVVAALTVATAFLAVALFVAVVERA